MVPENADNVIDSPSPSEESSLDAAALVARMVEVEEWPDPELLGQIVQAGDAAVEPLIGVLRTYPRGWPAEAPLYHAIGLLSVLRPPRAIPDLIEIIRRYGEDPGEWAARAVGNFGADGFEPLLEVVRDLAIRGYRRVHTFVAARAAAGDDPVQRARLAEVLRTFLADAIARGREEIRQWKMRRDLEESSDVTDLEDSGTDGSEFVLEDSGAPVSVSEPTEGEKGSDLDFYEEIALLVSDLADLADPAARDLINTAFEEDLVETFIIDKKFVDEQYRRGGEPARHDQDWLDVYRVRYQEHFDDLNRPPPTPMISTRPPSRAQMEIDRAPLPPVGETIRNVGPKLGRNDPCWCGSGKKYKKCHLGKDQR
jgi:hypothetical protein